MTINYVSTVFTRHNRPLHTLWLESQAWFCANELGRLAGRYFDEHHIRRLDRDQHRTVNLLRNGKYRETTMVSESGAYTLLVHHYLPENRHLRHWLTHEVVAVLRDGREPVVDDVPRMSQMSWTGERVVSVLYWQNDPWVRLRDMPRLIDEEVFMPDHPATRTRDWWGRAARAIGLRAK